MKINLKTILAFALFCSSLYGFKSKDAIKGMVCLKINACDYMIVCLANGNYSIMEDYYDKCDEEDILIGEFQSYGFKDVYNLTKDKSVRVYIEDWEIYESSALDEWKEECD